MKKIIITAALIGAISSSSAFAKTEGSYVGIDLIKRSASVKSNSDNEYDKAYNSEYYSHNKKDSSYGVGINYRYAFNFNKFFVAPGVSYSFISNEAKSGYSTSATDSFSQSVKLKDQLTFQTNFGYDISDQFAVYVPVGISSFGYEIKTSDVGGSYMTTSKKTGRDSSAFYGLGVSYQPMKNWVMSLEYNKYQDLKLDSVDQVTVNEGKIKANVEVEVVKLGLAYNF